MKKTTSTKKGQHPVVGIIYAGGSGKRLWPISTEKDPKQISSVFTGSILLKETYRRARRIFDKKDIYIVITKAIYEKVAHLLDLPPDHYFVQPRNDDTAIAMGVAALCLNSERPNVTAVTFYSDQTVTEFAQYEKAIRDGISAAIKYESLITIGTVPDLPSTQFGYIKLGKQFGKNLYRADAFIEKPPLPLAKKLVASQRAVWNTGTYIWQAPVLLRLFKNLAPHLYHELTQIEPESCHHRFSRTLKMCYDHIDSQSFDQAISEKTPNLMVVVGNYHWEDIGNWKTVYNLSAKDPAGNVVLGTPPRHLINVGAKNSLILSTKKIVSLVDVSDLIVIETKDSLLICSKDSALKVKEVAKKAESQS